MRIAGAADHAGYELKETLRRDLRRAGHELLDLGTHDPGQPDDYPDFAAALGQTIQNGQAARGVLICGSGVVPFEDRLSSCSNMIFEDESSISR